MENAIGAVPLYGIPKDKVKAMRLLSDGSELKVSGGWCESNYPDVVFVNVSDTPYLPDEVDTVL